MSLEAEIAKIPDRVDRGIKFLYETYGPDVFEKIDIESVDFRFEPRCIGGQLHPECFEEDSSRWLPREFYDIDLGFTGITSTALRELEERQKYLDALKEHWKQELEKDEILSGFGIL